MTSLPSVLLIDDRKDFRNLFYESLEEEVEQNLIEVQTAGDARKGLKIIDQKTKQGIPVLPIIDIILPGMSGLDLILEINSRPVKPKSIIISAHRKLSELKEIKKKYDWISDCLRKPFDEDIIRKKIREILKIFNTDITQFDYGSFDQVTASLLVEETQKIKSIMKRTVSDIIDIGRSLHKIKSKLNHGEYQLWIERELPLEYTTALNFMRVYDTFGDRKEEISQMGLSISVLYILASRNSSEEFCDEVFRRAKEGRPLSHAETKELKKEFLRRNKSSSDAVTIDVNYSVDTQETSDIENPPLKLVPNQTTQPQIKAKLQEVIKVVPKQNVWNLGDHILYRGLSNSPGFQNLLKSSTISFNIGFPNFADWTKEQLFSVPARSTLVYDSLVSYKSPTTDSLVFFDMLKKSIEFSTQEQSKIVVSFCPYPEIILLIEELDCQGFIAEPDEEKCQAIVDLWKKYEISLSDM